MPWAIARRFAHKTTSYGYLKTYWPAHALRFAPGVGDWAKGEGKKRRERSPRLTQPSDKSKDIKTVRVSFSFLLTIRLGCRSSSSTFLVSLSSHGSSQPNALPGWQRAAIKLSAFTDTGFVQQGFSWAALRFSIGDKEPGAIQPERGRVDP